MTVWEEATGIALTAQSNFSTALMVFLRIGAVMALLPGFAEQSVPIRIRLVLTLAFCAVVFPAVVDKLPDSLDLPLLAAEVAVGLTLGIGLRLLILALQFAGSIAAQSASLAQLFSSAGAEPQPAIATLFTVSALALAMHAGLHVQAVKLFLLSYDILPAEALSGKAAAEWGLAQVTRATALAFTLAAPFVLAGLVWNLALGLMSRAMPMLPVSFIGAPALSLGALAVLGLTVVAVLMQWQGVLAGFLSSPLALP